MKIVYRVHAIKRMFRRNISDEDVKQVLENGEVIESYEDDLPYPSCLMLGWVQERPIHVVAAENRDEKEMIVVTAYEPDLGQWGADFKTRKK